MGNLFLEPPAISHEVWEQKYRLKSGDGMPVDQTLDATWWRVAHALAAPEAEGRRERLAEDLAGAMRELAFLPAGRIIAGAGSGRRVTLFNCFVMGTLADDLTSIFDGVREAALTMQQGGGIGQDFSPLRPKGALVRSISADASGPVSFMDVWDAMCRTIMSAGARRGAMMATLTCDHPDIMAFIAAKSDPARLRNFNLSVLVSDAFMAAVAADQPWPLQHAGIVYRTVSARALWDELMRATYEWAEPGVVFIDRINAANNLAYCEEIRATNPCGEQPLPPHGACLLGSINLARLVEQPFTGAAAIPAARLERLVALAVRALDNAIDVSGHPLPAQQREATAKRRVGLGVTGLADALAMCSLRYGSPAAVAATEQWLGMIQRAAYLASVELASEKGAFPLFDAERFPAAPGVARLEPAIVKSIATHGIRNGCLTSIAPTGTISLLAGNVSSGIEPIFDLAYDRAMLQPDGSRHHVQIEDHAYRCFKAEHGEAAALPASLVTVRDLTPLDHLVMQAAAQHHVDSAISKTINCPEGIAFETFRDIYREAHALGLKGCTTFRPNAITGSVLTSPPEQPAAGASAAVPALAGRRAEPAQHEGAVHYLAPPLDRDPVLAGYTYKLVWPGNDHAFYITINDIERDGRRRPFEIFINTKNLEHFAWTVGLTRMISAVFRRGGDVSFVFEELQVIADPQGGRWMDGHYVPSLLAAIGGIIEKHMQRIGCIAAPQDAALRSESGMAVVAGGDGSGANGDGQPEADTGSGARPSLSSQSGLRLSSTRREAAPGRVGGVARAAGTSARVEAVPAHAAGPSCTRCGRRGLARREGCWVCDHCGDSRCG